jgi:hypothetical protein
MNVNNKLRGRNGEARNGAVLPGLSETHREELRASGLSAKTIRKGGFYTETDAGQIGLRLNWGGPAEQLGACLVFPFFDPDGRPADYVRLKPLHPRKDRAGREVKYESPKARRTGPTSRPASPVCWRTRWRRCSSQKARKKP